MRSSHGQGLLSLGGWLCAGAGCLAWVGLAWRAMSGLDEVTPESEEGGSLMARALVGTVLMIVGVVLLHLAADPDGRDAREERTPRA